ncbi:transposase, partial [Streptomyces sp. NPDC002476]|uniref:transposase n=1 Tax=Streptomyces sp. NPDC002476 TaxID=3364648 RepID=UPI0036B2F686
MANRTASGIPAASRRSASVHQASRGRALIDRRLYLPEDSWCSDPERRHTAGIPDEVQFTTKPRLAGEMIAAALDAGITASWVTGDEAYGQDPHLRARLEERGIGYVLAVACSTRVRINHGRTPVRADTAAGHLPATAWHPAERRPWCERPALLRLGLDPHRQRQPPPPARPPQPHHQGTRLLPVLVTCHGHPCGAGPRRRCPLERRGMLPGRQGTGRTRPLPGQTLDLVAPAHHARHARPGVPDRPRCQRGPRPARRPAAPPVTFFVPRNGAPGPRVRYGCVPPVEVDDLG